MHTEECPPSVVNEVLVDCRGDRLYWQPFLVCLISLPEGPACRQDCLCEYVSHVFLIRELAHNGDQ